VLEGSRPNTLRYRGRAKGEESPGLLSRCMGKEGMATGCASPKAAVWPSHTHTTITLVEAGKGVVRGYHTGDL